MGLYQHQQDFGGRPVVQYESAMELVPKENSYRIAFDWESEVAFEDLFAEFVSSDGAEEVTGLLTGAWSDEMYDEDTSEIVEALVSASTQLSSLEHLFVADIISEENEISWIQQSDLSPLWGAYPRLRTLQIRGGTGLSLGNVVHDQLKTLIIESGGLNQEVVQQVGRASLPALEHLEIWTGDPNYGASSTAQDLVPLLQEDRFPQLQYLGLCNCDYADALLPLLKDSPVVSRLKVLNLSMGTLSDDSLEQLLPLLEQWSHLERLNLDENMLSDTGVASLSGFDFVTAADQREGWTDSDGTVQRYPAVGE